MPRSRLLIVDDDPEVRYTLREALVPQGFDVDEAGTASEGVERVREQVYDLVLLDQRLPDAEGLSVVGELRLLQPQLLIVMMTAHGTRKTAIQAVDRGAYDFFHKPIKLDELRVVITRALERRALGREVGRLRARVASEDTFGSIIGRSAAMREVFATLEKVVSTNTTVLVLGESGTGKELVAQAVHERSGRAQEPFVKLNCVAIPQTLLESELFGHEKGAFTDAHQRRIGKFELADRGSILLDEIGDMSLETQAKILRVLQEREFERVGGVETVAVDVRVIAATNRDLVREVERGRFREDLYFRLNVVTVTLPALRQRPEDIPLLAHHFMAEAAESQGKPVAKISPGAMAALAAYDWPGNVRQLRHALERAVIWAEADEIRRSDLPGEVVAGSLVTPRSLAARDSGDLPALMVQIELDLVTDALRQAGGVQATAARRLGISERSMWHKVKKHNIDVERLKA